MQNKNIKEKAGFKGEYTSVSLASWVEKGNAVIDEVRKAVRANNKRKLEALRIVGVILDIKYSTNLIPTVGRNVLARLLAGDPTYSGEVDWGALGTAVSPSFTNASTQLGTEAYRAQATSQAFDDEITYIDWFIASGDVADQTFTEFGAFIDGSASADTGQAWSLLATGGWVKSGSMFISAKYTITNP
jgi:hypothetical protein